MSKELSSRNRRLMTIAAIGLCCAVSQAFAGSGGLLPGVQTAPGISAAQVLPAVSNPRPYRQVVFANCDTTVSSLGVPYGCVVRLDVITTGHLLQIDNINCGGINFNAEAAILFNTLLKMDAAHLVASLPAVPANSVIARGPYYFNQGEKPRFLLAGTGPTDQAFCSVTGTVWTAN